MKGLPWLDAGFLGSYPSRIPERAGVKAGLVGSLWLMGLTAVFAVPVGIASALVAVVGVPLAAIALVFEVFGRVFGPPAILACGLTFYRFDDGTIYLHEYASLGDLRKGLSGYFYEYNFLRPHQALQYRTPAEVFFGISNKQGR